MGKGRKGGKKRHGPKEGEIDPPAYVKMRSLKMKDEHPWRKNPSPGAEARLLHAGTPLRETALHWALSLAPSKPPKDAILSLSRNISL